MKSIRLRFFAAFLAVMLGTVIANSQTADSTAAPPPMHGPGMFGIDHHMIEFFSKFLDISDAQKTQMKAVLQKERTTMQPLMQQQHQLDEQLMQYVQGTYNETKVQEVVSAQSATLVQVKVEETRIHNELYQLLTPDQQTKLKEFMANREARMQQHMQDAPASDSQQ